MTKIGWLLAMAGLALMLFIWSAAFYQRGRTYSKSIPVLGRVIRDQTSNVEKEQQQVGQNDQFGQPGSQFGNFQGVGSSFNGGSFQGGFCGSLGAQGDSQPK